MKKQVDDGSIVIVGSSDILSMALGTSEPSGRVRGLGFGVTPSTYFNLPKRASRKYINELEFKLKEEQQRRMEAEQMRIEAEQKLSQLQNQLLNGHSSEKIASNTQKSDNRNCEFSSKRVMWGTSGSKSESISKRVMDNESTILYHVLS